MAEDSKYSRKKELNSKLDKLKTLKKYADFLYYVSIYATIPELILDYILLHKLKIEIALTYIFLYSLIGIAMIFLGKYEKERVNEEIKEVSDELDYLNSENQSEEIKSEKKFKMYQNELQKYYSQNLSHSQKIFWVGIISVILGFGIIGYTLWIISSNEKIDNSIQLMITGGIGGILSNFIGVVYLKMYSETLKVLTEFHNKLVYTQNLHFTNCLLAKVDTKELKEEILKESILLIVGKEKQ